jgi:hypothetical protein
MLKVLIACTDIEVKREAFLDRRCGVSIRGLLPTGGWALPERADGRQTREVHHRSNKLNSWAWRVGEFRIKGSSNRGNRPREQADDGKTISSRACPFRNFYLCECCPFRNFYLCECCPFRNFLLCLRFDQQTTRLTLA